MELVEVTQVGELRDHGESAGDSLSDLLRQNPESLLWTTGDDGWWPARALSNGGSAGTAWILRAPNLEQQIAGLAQFLRMSPGHPATRSTLRQAFMNGRAVNVALSALLADAIQTGAVVEAVQFIEEALPTLIDPTARKRAREEIIAVALTVGRGLEAVLEFALDNLSEAMRAPEPNDQLYRLIDEGCDPAVLATRLGRLGSEHGLDAFTDGAVLRLAQTYVTLGDRAGVASVTARVSRFKSGRTYLLSALSELSLDEAWLSLATTAYDELEPSARGALLEQALRCCLRVGDQVQYAEWSLRRALVEGLETADVSAFMVAGPEWLLDMRNLSRVLALDTDVSSRKLIKGFVKGWVGHSDLVRYPNGVLELLLKCEPLGLGRRSALAFAEALVPSETQFLSSIATLWSFELSAAQWIGLVSQVGDGRGEAIANMLAVHVSNVDDFDDVSMLWAWIADQSPIERHGVEWFRCALHQGDAVVIGSVYDTLTQRSLSLNTRRMLLKACLEQDLDRSFVERVISDVLVQDDVTVDELNQLHADARLMGFDVVEYQVLRRLMDVGGELEAEQLLRYGVLEADVFGRPDRSVQAFSFLIQTRSASLNALRTIYEFAFELLESSIQRRLLERWAEGTIGEEYGQVLWLLLEHVDQAKEPHRYQAVLDRLEVHAPSASRVWVACASFYSVREDYGQLMELHRRWLMHLTGTSRVDAVWALARLESVHGDPLDGLELALSILDEASMVEAFDWLYQQSEALNRLPMLAEVVEGLQVHEAHALGINLKLFLELEHSSNVLHRLAATGLGIDRLKILQSYVDKPLLSRHHEANALVEWYHLEAVPDLPLSVVWDRLLQVCSGVPQAVQLPEWVVAYRLLIQFWTALETTIWTARLDEFAPAISAVVKRMMILGFGLQLRTGILEGWRLAHTVPLKVAPWLEEAGQLLDLSLEDWVAFYERWCLVSNGDPTVIRKQFCHARGAEDLDRQWSCLLALEGALTEQGERVEVAELMLEVSEAQGDQGHQLMSRKAISDLNPDSDTANRAYLRYGVIVQSLDAILIAGERTFDSAALLADERQLWRPWLEARYELGDRTDGFLERLSEASRLAPDDRNLRQMRGQVYFGLGRLSDGLDLWLDWLSQGDLAVTSEEVSFLVEKVVELGDSSRITALLDRISGQHLFVPFCVKLMTAAGQYAEALALAERYHESGDIDFGLCFSCIQASAGVMDYDGVGLWASRALSAGVSQDEVAQWMAPYGHEIDAVNGLESAWILTADGLSESTERYRTLLWLEWLNRSNQSARAGVEMSNRTAVMAGSHGGVKAPWSEWLRLASVTGNLDEATRAHRSLSELEMLTPDDVLNFAGLRLRLGLLDAVERASLETLYENRLGGERCYALLSEAYVELEEWIRLYVHLSTCPERDDTGRGRVLRAWAAGMTGMHGVALDYFLSVSPMDMGQDSFAVFVECARVTARMSELASWCEAQNGSGDSPIAASMYGVRFDYAYQTDQHVALTTLLEQESCLWSNPAVYPAIALIGLKVGSQAVRDLVSQRDDGFAFGPAHDDLDWAPVLKYLHATAGDTQNASRVTLIEDCLPGLCALLIRRLTAEKVVSLRYELSIYLMLHRRTEPLIAVDQGFLSSELWDGVDEPLMFQLAAWVNNASILAGLCLERALTLNRFDTTDMILARLVSISPNLAPHVLTRICRVLEVCDWSELRSPSMFGCLMSIGVEVKFIEACVLRWLNTQDLEALSCTPYDVCFNRFSIDVRTEIFERLSNTQNHPDVLSDLLLELSRQGQIPSVASVERFAARLQNWDFDGRDEVIRFFIRLGGAYGQAMVEGSALPSHQAVDLWLDVLECYNYEIRFHSIIVDLLDVPALSAVARANCFRVACEQSESDSKRSLLRRWLKFAGDEGLDPLPIALDLVALNPPDESALNRLEAEFEMLAPAGRAHVLAVLRELGDEARLFSLLQEHVESLEREGTTPEALVPVWLELRGLNPAHLSANSRLYGYHLDAEDEKGVLEYGWTLFEQLELASSAQLQHAKRLLPYLGSDPNGRVKVLVALIHGEPEHDPYWLALKDAAFETQDWGVYTRCLAHIVKLAHAGPSDWLRLSDAQNTWLKDPVVAHRTLEEAWSRFEGDVNIFNALRGSFESQSDWSNLCQLIRSRLRLSSAGQQAVIFVELASLQAEKYSMEQAVKTLCEGLLATQCFSVLAQPIVAVSFKAGLSRAVIDDVIRASHDVNHGVEYDAYEDALVRLAADASFSSSEVIKASKGVLARHPNQETALMFLAEGAGGAHAKWGALAHLERLNSSPMDLFLWQELLELSVAESDHEIGLKAVDVLIERDALTWMLALRRFDLKVSLGEVASAVWEAMPFAITFLRQGYVEHFSLCVKSLAASGSWGSLRSILAEAIQFDTGFYEDYVDACSGLGLYADAGDAVSNFVQVEPDHDRVRRLYMRYQSQVETTIDAGALLWHPLRAVIEALKASPADLLRLKSAWFDKVGYAYWRYVLDTQPDPDVRVEAYRYLIEAPSSEDRLLGRRGILETHPTDTENLWELSDLLSVRDGLLEGLELVALWIRSHGVHHQGDCRRFLVECLKLEKLNNRIYDGVKLILQSSFVGGLSTELLDVLEDRIGLHEELKRLERLMPVVDPRRGARSRLIERMAHLYETDERSGKALEVLMHEIQSGDDVDTYGASVLRVAVGQGLALQGFRSFERTFQEQTLSVQLADFGWALLQRAGLSTEEVVSRALRYADAGVALTSAYWVELASGVVKTDPVLPQLLLRVGQVTADFAEPLKSVLLRFLDSQTALTGPTLRRLDGMVYQVESAAVLQRYGHRCLEQGLLELGCMALEAYAHKVDTIQASIEAGRAWSKAREHERALRLAQQVLQQEPADQAALELGVSSAYALGDLNTLAVYGLRRLEQGSVSADAAWVLGGLARLRHSVERHAEAVKWARFLLASELKSDLVWLTLVEHSTDRSEVKRGLRYFTSGTMHGYDGRRMLETAAHRFSHDLELARWVYERDPESERTQALLLSNLIDEPLSPLRFELHRRRFERHRGETDLDTCLRCIRESVIHIDLSLEFIERLAPVELRRQQKLIFGALRALGAYGQLANLIERMLSNTENVIEISELSRELAMIRHGHLSDPTGALDALMNLATHHKNLNAVTGLVERVAQETNTWLYLTDSTRKLLVEPGALSIQNIHQTLARWLANMTGTEMGQLSHLRESIALGDQTLESAIRMLQLVPEGSDERLWGLNVCLSRSSDIEERGELLSQVAQWHEANDDSLTAIATYRRIEREGGFTVVALESIARLGENLGQHTVVIDTLTRLIADRELPDRWTKVTRLVDTLVRSGALDAAIDRLWFEARDYGDRPLRRLIELCQKSARWVTMEGALIALIQCSVADEFEIREQLADLYLRALNDDQKAVRELLRLAEQRPDRVDILLSVVGLTHGAVQREHQWKLVHLLNDDDPRRLAMLRSLGREASPTVSRQCWLRVLDIMPEDQEALTATASLSLAEGDTVLFDHISGRMQSNVAVTARQQLEWARVAIADPSLRSEAVSVLRTLETDDTVAPESRRAQLSLYEQTERWSEAVEVIDRWMETGADDVDPLRVKRSMITAHRLLQPKAALLQLLLPQSCPRYGPAVVREVARLANHCQEWGLVLSQWDLWSDSDAECRYQSALWREYPVKALESAFAGFEDCARGDHRFVESVQGLARVAASLGIGYVERVTPFIDAIEDLNVSSALSRQIADFFLRQADDPQQALAWYQKVFAFKPDSQGVIEGLAECLERLERYEEAYALLGARRIQPEALGDRELWLAKNRMELGQLEDAAVHFNRALEAGVSERAIEGELRTMYRDLESWSALYGVLTRSLVHLEGGGLLERAREIARLAWFEMHDDVRAVEYWLYADDLVWDYRWLQEGIDALPSASNRPIVDRFVSRAASGTPLLALHLKSLIERTDVEARQPLQLRLLQEVPNDRDVRAAVVLDLETRGHHLKLTELLTSLPNLELSERRILVRSFEAIGDFARAETIQSHLVGEVPSADEYAKHGVFLLKLGRREDSVQSYLRAARTAQESSLKSEHFEAAITTLASGSDTSVLRFDILVEMGESIGYSGALVDRLTTCVTGRPHWVRLTEIAENMFWGDGEHRSLGRSIVDWHYTRLESPELALGFLRRAIDVNVLTVQEAGAMIEGYAPEDHSETVDQYLAWLVPDGSTAKERPVEALRRIRRILSGDGDRVVARELAGAVLQSYPRNEAVLPLLIDCCQDEGGMVFLTQTLSEVVERSLAREEWLRYADALYSVLCATGAAGEDIFSLCLQRLEMGGFERNLFSQSVEWAGNPSHHERLGLMLGRLDLTCRHTVEPALWLDALRYASVHQDKTELSSTLIEALRPFDGFSEAQHMALLPLLDSADDRLLILRRMLKVSAEVLSNEVLQLAHDLAEDGALGCAIGLLELYEETRKPDTAAYQLLLALLERDNQTVSLLDRLEALGPDATSDVIQKRLVLRATGLDDWVGTFLRLCTLLRDGARLEVGYDALRGVLVYTKGRVNMVQLARFIGRHPDIDHLTVCEIVLSDVVASVDADTFVRTLLEEGGYAAPLVAVWLSSRTGDELDEVVRQLLASEQSLLINTSPDAFYQALLRHPSLGPVSSASVLERWWQRARSSDPLQSEIIRRYDLKPRPELASLMVRMEPTVSEAFRVEFLRRLLSDPSIRLASDHRERLLREMESAEPSVLMWTEQRLDLAREEDALERRSELLDRLIEGTVEKTQRVLHLRERVEVLRSLGHLNQAMASMDELAEAVAGPTRLAVYEAQYELALAQDQPDQLVRIGLLLSGESGYVAQRLGAASIAGRLGRWADCLALLKGLGSIEAVRLRSAAYEQLEDPSAVLVELSQLVEAGVATQMEATQALGLFQAQVASLEAQIEFWQKVEGLGWHQDGFVKRSLSVCRVRSDFERLVDVANLTRFVDAIQECWIELTDAADQDVEMLLILMSDLLGADEAVWFYAACNRAGHLGLWSQFLEVHSVECQAAISLDMIEDALTAINDEERVFIVIERLLHNAVDAADLISMIWNLPNVAQDERLIGVLESTGPAVPAESIDFGLASQLAIRKAHAIHDPGSAYTCYRSGLERGLKREAEYDLLEAALRHFEAWLPLAELLEQRAVLCPESARVSLDFASEVYLEKSPQRAGLIRVLKLRLEHGDSERWVLDRLCVELEEDGQWTSLRDVLDAFGETPDDLIRVIRLERLLGEPNDARLKSLYERIWRLGGKCETYFAPLRSLYRVAKDDVGLETLSTYVASESNDPDLRIAANIERGLLAADSGRDATEIWRSILSFDPHHLVAIERIAHQLKLTGDVYALIALYQGHAPKDAEGIRFLKEAVELARNHGVGRSLRLELLESLGEMSRAEYGHGLVAQLVLERADLLTSGGEITQAVDVLLHECDQDTGVWSKRRERSAAELITSAPERFDDPLGMLVGLWRRQPSREMVGVFERALSVHVEQRLLDALVAPETLGECDKSAIQALIGVVCQSLGTVYCVETQYRVLDEYRVRFDQDDPDVLTMLIARHPAHDETWRALVETLYPIRPSFKLAVELADWFGEQDDLAPCAMWYRKALVAHPDDEPVMLKLLEVELEREQWRSALRLLDTLALRATSGRDAVAFLNRQLSLYAKTLGEAAKAEAVARRILRDAPRDEAAYAYLNQRFIEAEDQSSLRSLIEARLSYTEHSTLRLELARLCDDLDDTTSALKHWRRILAQDPSNEEALTRCYTLASDPYERRSLRTALMSRSPEGPARLELLVDEACGADEERQLGVALTAWRAVLDLEPAHAAANQRVEGILQETEDARGLGTYYLTKGRFLEAARVYENLSGGFVERINSLELALESSPGSMEVFTALEDIYRTSESWQKLTDLLKGRLPFVSDSDVVQKLQLQISEIEAHALGEPKLAFQDVLEAFDGLRSAALVQRLVELGLPLGEAKVVFDEAGDYLRVLGKGSLLLELSRGLYETGDLKEAMSCFNQAIRVGVDVDAAGEVFDNFALSQACMGHADILVTQLEGVSPPRANVLKTFALRGYIFNRNDAVLSEVSTDIDMAEVPTWLLSRVVGELSYTPHYHLYRDWLGVSWERTASIDTLRTLIELNLVQLGAVAEAERLLMALGGPYSAADIELSMGIYAEREAFDTADFIRFVDLDRVDELSVNALFSFISILLSVDNEAGAALLLSQVVSRSTKGLSNATPFENVPFEMLNALTASDKSHLFSSDMLPLFIRALMTDAGSGIEQWPNILRMLTEGTSTTAAHEAVVDWLFDRGLHQAFFEHCHRLVIGLPVNAVSRIAQLLVELLPEDGETVTDAWMRMFKKTGNFKCGHLLWTHLDVGGDRLAVGHALLSDPRTDAPLSADIYLEHASLAGLESDRLKYLEAGVRLKPDDDSAFERLVELHTAKGHLDRVSRLFDERLERMPGFASSRSFYRHKGETLKSMGSLLGAERAFRAAVDLGDGFEDRCDLGDVLWAQRKLKDYVSLEIRTLKLSGDKRTRFDLTLSRLESNGDVQSIFRYLAHALQEVVPHEDGLQRLLSTMEQTSRYWETVKTLQVVAELQGGAQRTRILMYAGDIYSQRLNRLDAAAECYRGCLSGNPLFEEARIALVRVLGRQGLHSELVAEASDLSEAGQVSVGRVLVDAYRFVDYHEAANGLLQGCFDLEPGSRAIFTDLFNGLRRQGKHALAVEAAERFLNAGGHCDIEMVRELAALSLNELSSQPLALKWLKRIPSNAQSTQDRLLEIECYFAPALRNALPDWLDARVSTAGSDGTAVALCKRICDGFEKGEFHGAQAVAWLEVIVDQIPRSYEALSLILEVAESAQLHHTIGRTLLKLLRLPIGAERETEVLTRLGVLNATMLKAPEQAIGYLERSLKRAPAQLDARLLLAGIYLDRDFAKRALALLAEIQHVVIPEQAVEFKYLVLVLRAASLVKASKVEWAAERLLSLQPDSQLALEILANRAANEADWDKAERLVLELLAHHRAHMEPKALSNWLYVLGTVHEFKMGYQVAVTLYRESLEVDPSNERAGRALRNEEGLPERQASKSDLPSMESLLTQAQALDSD